VEWRGAFVIPVQLFTRRNTRRNTREGISKSRPALATALLGTLFSFNSLPAIVIETQTTIQDAALLSA
jgi:hypothetical protein